MRIFQEACLKALFLSAFSPTMTPSNRRTQASKSVRTEFTAGQDDVADANFFQVIGFDDTLVEFPQIDRRGLLHGSCRQFANTSLVQRGARGEVTSMGKPSAPSRAAASAASATSGRITMPGPPRRARHPPWRAGQSWRSRCPRSPATRGHRSAPGLPGSPSGPGNI